MSLILLAIIFPILLLSCSILYVFSIPKETAVGFKSYPIVGTTPDFLLNRHRFLEWTTEVLSQLPTNTAVFHRPLGGAHGVLTAAPGNVEHVLKTRFDNYPKGPRFLSILKDFLGDGIFNSDGQHWLLQRKTASFEFNKRTLKGFLMDLVNSEIQTRLNPVLTEASRSNQVVDMQDVLERFAFDNVCRLAFSVDPGCLGGAGQGGPEDSFMLAFDEATALSSGRFLYALPMGWKIMRLLNLGSERKLNKAIRTVHEFADRIIRLRLEEQSKNGGGNKYEDLLSRFVDNNNEDISPDLLRDVVISVILAGKDTTSTGLSWLFWLLSTNPDVVSKIRCEIDELRVKVGKRVGDPFAYEELREMQYLHAVISESLRLYPPVPVDTKACLEDDTLPDGTKVKKGWFVMYHTYAMGRMEGIWGKDCYKFRPERWLENGTYSPNSPFRYPVFHAGPRICLGKEMAYIQMKSIVASVVERFEVDVVNKEKRPEYLLSLTLRIKGGLPVKLEERSM